VLDSLFRRHKSVASPRFITLNKQFKVAVEYLPPLLHINQTPGPYLVSKTIRPHCDFSWFFLVPPDRFCDGNLPQKSGVAFYARICPWRRRIMQDKFWNKCVILTEFFLGFALFRTLHIKWDFINIFLYCTISNSRNMRQHSTIFCGESSGRGVKLTTHQLVPRSRIRGSIQLLPHTSS
jgi:hypothetical protein